MKPRPDLIERIVQSGRSLEDDVIEFHSVTKRYGDRVVAVRNFSVIIPARQTTVFVGPPGCGKTSLLRMINRLVEPTSGSISIDGVDVTDRNGLQLRRSIGFVLQASGLLPHRSVFDNISTGPIRNGVPKLQARSEVYQFLRKVGLDESVATKYPYQLSAGQRQSVGFARALAGRPDILLMDEPFGSVEPRFRTELANELQRLQREIGNTIVFATRDIDQAFAVGDLVVTLKTKAEIIQAETPSKILKNPRRILGPTR